MFIELLVVGAIMMLLYQSGFLGFNSGYAVAISIVVALIAGGIGFLTTHFIARTLVDRLFGFNSWSPAVKPEKKGAVDPAILRELQDLSDAELQKRVRLNPKDAEFSRLVSETYLQKGQMERFVEERLRAIHEGLLTREQVCAVYNRLADVRTKEDRIEEAVHFLQQLIVTYPGTVEAHNAERRCALLRERAAMADQEPA